MSASAAASPLNTLWPLGIDYPLPPFPGITLYFNGSGYASIAADAQRGLTLTQYTQMLLIHCLCIKLTIQCNRNLTGGKTFFGLTHCGDSTKTQWNVCCSKIGQRGIKPLGRDNQWVKSCKYQVYTYSIIYLSWECVSIILTNLTFLHFDICFMNILKNKTILGLNWRTAYEHCLKLIW